MRQVNVKSLSTGLATVGDMKNTRASADEQVLLEGLRAGDEQAFQTIYTRYRRSVLFVAHAVVGSSTVAEDIAQEVFLALWRRPEAVQLSRGTLQAYLGTLAHHRAVDHVRKEESRRRRCLKVAHDRACQQDASIADIGETVTTEFDTRARVNALRSALEDLSDPQRVAVDLAFFGERSYRAVGAELGVPEGTVKTRIRAAMMRLRSCPELVGVGLS